MGELWFGFLDYFARKFDFAQEVIQIRQTEPLMKLDKGWQLRPIAIEDPFDLNHNLSSGVHSKSKCVTWFAAVLDLCIVAGNFKKLRRII